VVIAGVVERRTKIHVAPRPARGEEDERAQRIAPKKAVKVAVTRRVRGLLVVRINRLDGRRSALHPRGHTGTERGHRPAQASRSASASSKGNRDRPARAKRALAPRAEKRTRRRPGTTSTGRASQRRPSFGTSVISSPRKGSRASCEEGAPRARLSRRLRARAARKPAPPPNHAAAVRAPPSLSHRANSRARANSGPARVHPRPPKHGHRCARGHRRLRAHDFYRRSGGVPAGQRWGPISSHHGR